MKKRVIFGAIALVIFIPFLLAGGSAFQLFIGILSIIGVYELLRMKQLEPTSVEGVLAMLGAFVLTVPMQKFLPFLSTDGSLTVYTLIVFLILAGTVMNSKNYSFDSAVFPIGASFYVGIGFQNLINARLAGIDMVLFALFIVWSTDIGAYLFGRRFGKNKLMPAVSPNKTIEGSLGGILAAVIVSIIFMIADKTIYASHHFILMILFVIIFSLVAQFGDLVESALKRHFGVKDSGKLIPGHGGILDRFDSMIFVFPIMHLLGLF